MKVLGITDHIISGAAIIEDGKVLAAVNEERLVRKKMVMGFPRKSIEAVLKMTNVRPDEIDNVSVASQWGSFLNNYVDFLIDLNISEQPTRQCNILFARFFLPIGYVSG